MRSLKNRLSNKLSNLNLSRLILLIFSIAPALTVTTIVFIIAESALWFATMYGSKNLIQMVGRLDTRTSNSEHDLIASLIFTFSLAVSYTAVKLISTIIVEYQSSKVSEYIGNKIHERAIHLDLYFY